ncbi:MAG: GNAT family N-acetyltransferase [Actinomycetota bacterium]
MPIDLVDPETPAADLESELATLLIDSVEGGASVGFLTPLGYDDARQWWAAALRSPGTLTFTARVDGRLVGVVQLNLVGMPNGAHRAEVAKLLVHRAARGRGLARALLERLEAEALARGRWLLVLDTETGSPAESIYQRFGWTRVGSIDDYAGKPDGELIATTVMFKKLVRRPEALPR